MVALGISLACLACLGVGIFAGLGIAAGIVRKRAPQLYGLLQAHFAPLSVGTLTITERQFPARIRVDLHRCIDRLFQQCTIAHLSGVRTQDNGVFGVNLSELLVYQTTAFPIPVEYEEVDIGEESPVRCLRSGLWLIEIQGAKAAVLLSKVHGFNEPPRVKLDIAIENSAAGREFTTSFFKTLEDAVRTADAYRGKVLSLDASSGFTGESCGVMVHHLPPVERSEIVLPEKTLTLLERNVIQFVEQRQALEALGQSVKKGLLLHGPPGNGKTHTIRYLIGELRGHTTLLISAEQVAHLAEYMALARLLQPAVVVLEDVDLIARERERADGPCQESLLNKLLNEMDGLKEDAAILFLLTTNRPEDLEQAIASRPGRIDQAIEFPLPDQAGRAKLARLYSRSVEVSDELIQFVADRTANVSAAFIKELMRRAIQFHVATNGTPSLTVTDFQRALDELLVDGGRLNRTLLGAHVEPILRDKA